jgi:putative transposase
LKRKRWKTEQILEILKAAESPGITVQEVCRIYGVGQSCFYRWREKDEGLRVGEARRLKELEDENRRLKQLLANRDLELDAVQRGLRKNSLGHSNGGRR